MTTIIIVITRPLNPPSNRHRAQHSVINIETLLNCLDANYYEIWRT